MFGPLITLVRDLYRTREFIPLHAPVFAGNERAYVMDTIDSTFVSSVGEFVDRFERDISAYTGSASAVGTVNGTAALHIALKLAGVVAGDLVITQALTFVATCNAIAYCNAEPVFADVDRTTFGLSPKAVDEWLSEHAVLADDGLCRSRVDGRVIRACLPMHTFGMPVDLDGLVKVCSRWRLALVEDAAESLGSFYKGRHTGTFGLVGTLSFNGNKIITTGGGGMILAEKSLGHRAKHLTTTAKQPHAYEYVHDELGYNYRMPNINAALGCAQLESIEHFVAAKRRTATIYEDFFRGSEIEFVKEPPGSRANYWLNSVVCADKAQRDAMLKVTNESGVMTRPIWRLMSKLPVYSSCARGNLANSEWLEDRVVNLPSSVLTRESQ